LFEAAWDTLIATTLLLQLPTSSPKPPEWPLGHFATLLLCALLISVVFGCVFHPTAKTRILAVLRYFLLLIIFTLALTWLMLPFSH
jgi:hypothetical protein